MQPPNLRYVHAGDPIPVEVQGGWVRRPAPCDGVVVESETVAFFVPVVQLRKVMRRK